MIEQGLIQFLLNDPAITAVVKQRVRPMKSGQGDGDPRITLHPISWPQVYSQDGPVGLCYPRIQVECWGKNYNDARSLADLVRKSTGGVANGPKLDGFKGTLPDGTVVQAIFIDDRRGDDYPPQHADDQGEQRYLLDLIIWYVEP